MLLLELRIYSGYRSIAQFIESTDLTFPEAKGEKLSGRRGE